MRYFRNGTYYFLMVASGEIQIDPTRGGVRGIGLRYNDKSDTNMEIMLFYIDRNEMTIDDVPENIRKKFQKHIDDPFF